MTGGTLRRWTGSAFAPSPSAPLWTPAAISPTAWLKADAIGGVNNDPVATWADSSGNAHDATQVTSSKRPILKTAVLNGLPGVRFSPASATGLIWSGMGAALSGDDTYSFFWVTAPSDLGNYPILLTYPVDTGWSFIVEYDSSGGFYWADGGSPTAASAGFTAGNHLISMVKEGATLGQFYKSGTFIGTVATPAGGVKTGDMQLGGYTTAAYGMAGDIHEVVMFTTNLDTTNRQKVEGYLAWKWGLVAGLPSGHPYKASAP